MSPEERGGGESGKPTSGDASEESKDNNQYTEGYERSGEDYAQSDPDVLLDVPKLHVDELNLEVEELKARVTLRARLSELLEIDVGLDVALGKVKLETKGVDAEAQLKARLENVQAMIERTLSSIDDNPKLIQDLTNLAGGGSGGEEEKQDLEESDSSKGITEAAMKKAEELGVDPYSLEGTGSKGRVILGDVQRAARDS